MDQSRGGGPRLLIGALVVVATVISPGAAGPAFGTPGPTTGTLPPPVQGLITSTALLPAVPTINPEYTDGRPAGELLANAVSMASLGVDDTALVSAIGATQAELDNAGIRLRELHAAATAAAAAAATAFTLASNARAHYADMSNAIRQAAVFLYMSGPEPLPVSSRAGMLGLYAPDYAESTIGPFGVLARSEQLRRTSAQEMGVARREATIASGAETSAAAAVAAQQADLKQLENEMKSASAASESAFEADHMILADQAGQELSGLGDIQFSPAEPLPAPLPTTSVALTWAFAELGKQYEWGSDGPETFDCSGLTQYVWKQAGVTIPRVASDQDDWTVPVPLSELLPGDLVFFGTTDIHHVGIYIGDGLMINAPHTGTVVQVSSMWWSDLAGFGRVHSLTAPVPPHTAPTATKPTKPSVILGTGPVPSQTKPPPGWAPGPGLTAPIALGGLDGSIASGQPAPSALVTDPTTSATTSVASPTSTTTTIAGGSSELDSPTTTATG